MTYHVLLVEPDPQSGALMERLLSSAGCAVERVTSFEDASRRLSSNCPDLLITAERLGPFNGLHLVIRYRAAYPDAPMVVTSKVNDRVLRAEVRQYGARFLKMPVRKHSFLRFISHLLTGRTPRPASARRWPRKYAALPATVSRTAGRIVDLSYGGLCLQFEGSPTDFNSPIHVALPSLGFEFEAFPRWTKTADSGSEWWCGAEVAPADTDSWRSVVDSL